MLDNKPQRRLQAPTFNSHTSQSSPTSWDPSVGNSSFSDLNCLCSYSFPLFQIRILIKNFLLSLQCQSPLPIFVPSYSPLVASAICYSFKVVSSRFVFGALIFQMRKYPCNLALKFPLLSQLTFYTVRVGRVSPNHLDGMNLDPSSVCVNYKVVSPPHRGPSPETVGGVFTARVLQVMTHMPIHLQLLGCFGFISSLWLSLKSFESFLVLGHFPRV